MLIICYLASVHMPPSRHLQGADMLKYLIGCSHEPQVLLDSGALLVSLTNKQVAELWLSFNRSAEGVVSINI